MSGTLSPYRTHPRLDGSVLLSVCAGVLLLVAVVETAMRGVTAPAVAGVFGCLVAVGEMVRLRLPDDRVQAPIGLATALGYALLSHLPTEGRASHSILQTVAVTSGGMLAGALPHVLAGRSAELEGIARRVLVVAGVALLFRPLVLDDELFASFDSHVPSDYVLLTVVVGLVAWPLEAVLAAGVAASQQWGPFRALLRNELGAFFGIGAAIASTGVLIPLATWEVGLWGLPLVTIPLLLAQLSYRRYAAIRRTQVQTIQALSRATEVGGYTDTGHARRVTALALAIGRDLGLPERRMRVLQYAALMHDLGQLSLTDAIPGGATVLVTPDERRRIATFGAQVVRQTGVLEDVAEVVEAQAEPYRRPHLPDDPTVPQESRIIKVVNAYDDMVGRATSEDARLEALEGLRLGMAYEYDPRVVASLARVLDRVTPAPR
ncbi:HD-GYP domain-containing protein [Actinopolymorpha singaporensis]|uniref:HD domain-containing protein n=1 Tax=Actinopolymorpha singaporensis TaxID=117157 RepID=A0A1H1YMX4_9ACTN|nr:HD domain-containing phosphohydrolase [Actinopolymorpha singaporensis]SDT22818.1 HD domain-containing protein [Actinopolymorpha singaporensis]